MRDIFTSFEAVESNLTTETQSGAAATEKDRIMAGQNHKTRRETDSAVKFVFMILSRHDSVGRMDWFLKASPLAMILDESGPEAAEKSQFDWLSLLRSLCYLLFNSGNLTTDEHGWTQIKNLRIERHFYEF